MIGEDKVKMRIGVYVSATLAMCSRQVLVKRAEE